MDTGIAAAKTCPECAEQIKDAAHVCRFCGFRFADPTASSGVAARKLSDIPASPSTPDPGSPTFDEWGRPRSVASGPSSGDAAVKAGSSQSPSQHRLALGLAGAGATIALIVVLVSSSGSGAAGDGGAAQRLTATAGGGVATRTHQVELALLAVFNSSAYNDGVGTRILHDITSYDAAGIPRRWLSDAAFSSDSRTGVVRR